MFFSIIIPVYNVAPYLCRALDSVLQQEDAGDIEIILVDDGSSDGSGEICDEYARSHDYIRVVHQRNSGQAVARNAGLGIASGEYILFLDSDDSLDLKAIAKFRNILQHAYVDVLGYSYREKGESGDVLREWKLEYADNEVVHIADLMEKYYFLPSVWLYVCRRSFLEDNGLRFVTGIYHEDEEFIARMMCFAKTGFFLNECLYNYYHHSNSTMFRRDSEHLQKRILDSGIIIKSFSTFLNSLKDSPVKYAYIQDQINIVNYRIFLNLIAPTFEYSWAKKIYDSLCFDGFIPLRRGRPGMKYRTYRWLTLFHLPFWGFRLLYRLIIGSSKLRKCAFRVL